MRIIGRVLALCLAAILFAPSLYGAAAAQAGDHPSITDHLETPVVTPVKYSLKDLSKKDRARFWRAVEDLAVLDVLVAMCERPQRYDRQLRKQIKSCVDPNSVARVQSYFNSRRAHFERTATPYACKNPRTMQSMARFRRMVDEGLQKLGRACSLCFFC